MKKIIIFSALFICFLTFAQVPQGISYQAVALNSSGTPIVSSNVRVKLSILDATPTGTVLYSETQLKTTNANGLFNLNIGQGTVVSGAFNAINWGTNSKFLKVEMDATGGTTYVLVGTTQLLSVPYALAADSLVTSAGEGITLVSPNGTPYQLTVDNSGNLSLPTSGSAGTIPSQLYAYGTFNSFNPTTSLLYANSGEVFYGYKYLTSGGQVKFLADNNTGATVYGLNSSNELAVGGSAYNVTSNGFYHMYIYHSPGNAMQFDIEQIGPQVYFMAPESNSFHADPDSYNPSTNTFSYTFNGVTNENFFLFEIRNVVGGTSGAGTHGDFLSDGTLDINGPAIVFPGATSTPKNYRIDLVLNFNGSGTYTVTQLP